MHNNAQQNTRRGVNGSVLRKQTEAHYDWLAPACSQLASILAVSSTASSSSPPSLDLSLRVQVQDLRCHMHSSYSDALLAVKLSDLRFPPSVLCLLGLEYIFRSAKQQIKCIYHWLSVDALCVCWFSLFVCECIQYLRPDFHIVLLLDCCSSHQIQG